MKKLSGMIALLFCLFLVTSTATAVSLEPTNVIENSIFQETKTTAETPDIMGGVLGIPNTDERTAILADIRRRPRVGCSGRGMVGTRPPGLNRWHEHPAFIGIC